MKRIYLLLTICLAMVACKKNDVKFIYSPEAPRAGQAVTFTNQTSSGQDWEWSFGDGGVSTLKSPSHTYQKPGKYLVSLKVDKKNAWMATKEVEVYDTVPTFTASDSVFCVFKDYTFTAQVYNPYNYDVEYEWSLPLAEAYAQVSDTTMKGSSLHLCFTRVLAEAPVTLRVVVIADASKPGDTTIVKQTFLVTDQPTNSILMRTDEGDWRQRIFGKRAEKAKLDATATALLDAEVDTFQVYNRDDTFRLSELQILFPTMQGFHIGKRKLYFRDEDGLWVANIDGSYFVPIDTALCSAMTLDMTDNRIYWANEDGVWYMPFVGSDNNQFITVPTQLNDFGGVTRLAADSEKK